MRKHGEGWTQGAALIIGAALGALALSGWTVPGGAIAPPAELTLTALSSTLLDVRPAGTTAVARQELRAGSPALAGSVRLFNATGSSLAVRVRAQTQEPQLVDTLRLRVRLGTRTLFEGSLRELERAGSRRFVLASHARARVVVQAWIPGSARDYEAWVVHVELRFVTSAADASS